MLATRSSVREVLLGMSSFSWVRGLVFFRLAFDQRRFFVGCRRFFFGLQEESPGLAWMPSGIPLEATWGPSGGPVGPLGALWGDSGNPLGASGKPFAIFGASSMDFLRVFAIVGAG